MIRFENLSLGEAAGLRYAYDLWLFHEAEHLLIQAANDWRILAAIREKDQTVVAHIPVHTTGVYGASPKRAPFGSIQCSDAIPPKHLYEFIGFICSTLAANGVRRLQLTSAPQDLLPQHAIINTFLLNYGFEIRRAELGALLFVEDDFEQNVNDWEKRRLRQAHGAGLDVRKIEHEELQKTYAFIAACRDERGYPFAISFDTLEQTVKTFPNRFHLFGVFDGPELAAASISVDVGNQVLYDFHSAHPRRYDALSPVVLLKERMYNFCREHSYRILDLGTSAVDGEPNFGLIDFKFGLGGKPTVKLSFQKNL